jgi:hypothetical protein
MRPLFDQMLSVEEEGKGASATECAGPPNEIGKLDLTKAIRGVSSWTSRRAAKGRERVIPKAPEPSALRDFVRGRPSLDGCAIGGSLIGQGDTGSRFDSRESSQA